MTPVASLPAAGRELDRLIAEHVFGLVRCQAGYAHGPEGYPNDDCYALPESPDQGGELRSYSTDISDAWQVVEKMLPHSLHLWAPGALINDEFGTHAKRWTAQFIAWPERAPDGGIVGTNPPNWYGQEAEAETAPEAICLAALKAVAP